MSSQRVVGILERPDSVSPEISWLTVVSCVSFFN
jgi:hypothetical protein